MGQRLESESRARWKRAAASPRVGCRAHDSATRGRAKCVVNQTSVMALIFLLLCIAWHNDGHSVGCQRLLHACTQARELVAAVVCTVLEHARLELALPAIALIVEQKSAAFARFHARIHCVARRRAALDCVARCFHALREPHLACGEHTREQ